MDQVQQEHGCQGKIRPEVQLWLFIVVVVHKIGLDFRYVVHMIHVVLRLLFVDRFWKALHLYHLGIRATDPGGSGRHCALEVGLGAEDAADVSSTQGSTRLARWS